MKSKVFQAISVFLLATFSIACASSYSEQQGELLFSYNDLCVFRAYEKITLNYTDFTTHNEKYKYYNSQDNCKTNSSNIITVNAILDYNNFKKVKDFAENALIINQDDINNSIREYGYEYSSDDIIYKLNYINIPNFGGIEKLNFTFSISNKEYKGLSLYFLENDAGEQVFSHAHVIID